jgi:hypothetical protein
MADPITIGTAIAAFAPEMIGMEAAIAAAPEVLGGLGAAGAAGAGAAGATAVAMPTIAEAMSPLAMEAGGGATAEALSPVASEMYGGAGNIFSGAGKDKFAALLEKYGPKAAGMLANDLNEPAPRMQSGGGPRMGGQQQAAAPVAIDYGGAAQRKPAGSAALLGIDDEEFKRLLMSLRGY